MDSSIIMDYLIRHTPSEWPCDGIHGRSDKILSVHSHNKVEPRGMESDDGLKFLETVQIVRRRTRDVPEPILFQKGVRVSD